MKGLVQPAPPLDPEGSRCQTVVNALVASWPTPRVEAIVTCRPASPDESGHYLPGSQRATVGINPTLSDDLYRSIAAHELGHAWADIHLDSPDQRRIINLRGFTSWGGAAEEDYADVFATAFGEGLHTPNLVAPVTPELIATLRAKGLLPD